MSDCLGYVHQPELEWFGYVFRWPKTGDGLEDNKNDGSPITLHTLLRNAGYPPLLGTPLAIMHAVATSIWYLLATNWLHKVLRSENVIFPSSHNGPATPVPLPLQRIMLGDPFLSGFEYSRPAEVGEGTERPAANQLYHELYSHPNVQFDLRENQVQAGQRRVAPTGFRKIYDVYALGVVLLEVVLLEVALWQPMHTLVGGMDERAVTLREVRAAWTALAEERTYEGQLRAMVGDRVAEAVMVCITGKLADSKNEQLQDGKNDDLLLQTGLGESVVQRLDEVVV